MHNELNEDDLDWPMCVLHKNVKQSIKKKKNNSTIVDKFFTKLFKRKKRNVCEQDKINTRLTVNQAELY